MFVDWQQPNHTAEVVEGHQTLTILPVLSELGITSLRVEGLAQKMGQRTDGLMTGALLNAFVLVVSRVLRHDKLAKVHGAKRSERKEKNPPKQARKLQTYTIIKTHV